MSESTQPQEKLATTIAKTVAIGAASAVGGTIGEVAATATIQVLDRLGREVIAYSFSSDEDSVDLSQLPAGKLGGDAASFAVIGLGRCGSRVTAELARMIAESKRTSQQTKEDVKPTFADSVRRYLSKPKSKSTLRLEPVMVIGDINAATFAEVDQLGEADSLVKEVLDGMLRIDYRPLAQGGVGNIPLFGEFFTRALLSLPPAAHRNDMHPWALAREYLLRLCSLPNARTRLAFYIFGAAGGSGSGAAAELMRSQRFAIKQRRDADPHIYYTGVAVIPEASSENDFQRRNSGRTIVQYLADLNIRLNSDDDYQAEPVFQYATHVTGDGRAALPPWDSLGIVSNEVMQLFAGQKKDQHTAERMANQYIAQQVFNLAAAQSQPKEFKGPDVNDRPDDIVDTPVQFEGVHLDTEDLRMGLRGPFAFGFAAVSRQEIDSHNGVEELVLRALDVPRIVTESTTHGLPDLVQGISISPQKQGDYTKLFDDFRSRTDSTAGTELISLLSKIPFFKRCPRLIFVLTSPIDLDVTVDMRKGVATTLSRLCPNLKQARFAIVRGTTQYYTLSIYFESSVVLCHDVAQAIVTYVRDCWKPRTRSVTREEFNLKYSKYVKDDLAPLPEDEIVEWLGESEQYGKNATDFDNQAINHTSNWIAFVDSLKKSGHISEPDAVRLQRHSVEQCTLSPRDIAAAFRYINYVAHVEKSTLPDVPDFS